MLRMSAFLTKSCQRMSRILRRHRWSTVSNRCISALLIAQHSDPQRRRSATLYMYRKFREWSDTNRQTDRHADRKYFAPCRVSGEYAAKLYSLQLGADQCTFFQISANVTFAFFFEMARQKVVKCLQQKYSRQSFEMSSHILRSVITVIHFSYLFVGLVYLRTCIDIYHT